MICPKCRNKKHEECVNRTKREAETPDPKKRDIVVIDKTAIDLTKEEPLVPVSFNWCDCQHVTEGTSINRQLVPVLPQERV